MLSFLTKGVSITPNPPKETSHKKIDRNPVTADLRIFSNGALYPSALAVKKFNLSYQNKNSDQQGNAFDVILSTEFPNTASSATSFLMIAPVDKTSPKVDLFGTTRWNDDGTPKASVMDQGAPHEWLVDLIYTTYGIEPPAKGVFIDLVLVKEQDLAYQLKVATNGIYYVPKAIVRGVKAGAPSYVRRENLDIYVLVPKSLLIRESSNNMEDTDGEVSSKSTESNLLSTAVASIGY